MVSRIPIKQLTTYLNKTGGIVRFDIDDWSAKPTYSGDNLSYYEIFNGATQTTPNRLARLDLTYSGDNVTVEEWKIYDTADGTTVLTTLTMTYTYSGDQITKAVLVET